MQTVKSVSWVRMVLAFGAVLLVGGAGLSMAAGPVGAYVPVSSIITGPNTVAVNSTTQFNLVVTFNDGSTATFPPTTGATFSSIPAGAVSSTGVFTAPGTAQRAKITGTYTKNGTTTSASKLIFVQ